MRSNQLSYPAITCFSFAGAKVGLSFCISKCGGVFFSFLSRVFYNLPGKRLLENGLW